MYSKRQCARSPPEWRLHDVTLKETHVYRQTQLLKGNNDETTLHK